MKRISLFLFTICFAVAVNAQDNKTTSFNGSKQASTTVLTDVSGTTGNSTQIEMLESQMKNYEKQALKQTIDLKETNSSINTLTQSVNEALINANNRIDAVNYRADSLAAKTTANTAFIAGMQTKIKTDSIAFINAINNCYTKAETEGKIENAKTEAANALAEAKMEQNARMDTLTKGLAYAKALNDSCYTIRTWTSGLIDAQNDLIALYHTIDTADINSFKYSISKIYVTNDALDDINTKISSNSSALQETNGRIDNGYNYVSTIQTRLNTINANQTTINDNQIKLKNFKRSLRADIGAMDIRYFDSIKLTDEQLDRYNMVISIDTTLSFKLDTTTVSLKLNFIRSIDLRQNFQDLISTINQSLMEKNITLISLNQLVQDAQIYLDKEDSLLNAQQDSLLHAAEVQNSNGITSAKTANIQANIEAQPNTLDAANAKIATLENTIAALEDRLSALEAKK